MASDYKTQSISWKPRDLLASATNRAEQLGVSLSQYVCILVREDLKKGGSLVLEPAQIKGKPSVSKSAREAARSAARSAASEASQPLRKPRHRQ